MKTTVTAIILTAGRAEKLRVTVDSLLGGSRVPDEILVVNNGTDEDIATVRDMKGITVVAGPGGSYAEARNLGVERATSEWVFFIDDDCEADRLCLGQLMRKAEAQKWDACGGIVLPAPAFDTPDWYSPELAWAIGCSTPGDFGPLAGRLHLANTSNLLCRRSVALEHPFQGVSGAGFDYATGREDAQFWRGLRRAGLFVGMCGRALVWHHIGVDRLEWRRLLSRARADGRSSWNRDRIPAQRRTAARDIVNAPMNALREATGGEPISRAWRRHRTWAARQFAFLSEAVDDQNASVSPSDRLGALLSETAGAGAALAKAATRNVVTLGWNIRRQRELPSLANPPKRIGVVLFDLLGDTVLALPMISQLSAAFPNSRIKLLSGSQCALLAAQPWPNVDVVEIPAPCRGTGPRAGARLQRFMSALKMGAIIVAYANGLNPAGIFATGAPVIAWPEDNGLRQQLWGELLAAPVAKTFDKAETVALLDLLAPLGIRTETMRPVLNIGTAASNRVERVLGEAGTSAGAYGVVHLEPSGRGKFWPIERSIELANRLSADFPIFLVGSRASRIATEKPRIDGSRLFFLQGLLNSGELAALLSKAAFFAGADSGPAHVAQAVCCPSVIMFGETEPHRWGPLPRLIGEPDLPFTVLRGAPGDWLTDEKQGLAEGAGLLSITIDTAERAIRALAAGKEKPSRAGETH